ncbi:MAG: hypothetical protein A3G41_00325 [Elusimicrobia bacterium RIFCSPLOWO2_12_FULL_59_9]|nr:MAG: hypothetical protein A3G41_00325 [Elusimicrobia bacterium RIFCSPLOWO2_12_FULL_59_9]
MPREWLHAWLGWMVVAAGIAGIGLSAYRTWEVSQPVPFTHKKHVDFGISCDACHVGAKDSAKAGIPNTSTCALCHQPDKPGLKTPKTLEEYIRQMREIPWKKVYTVPQHVRFSHKRHVGSGGLDCKVCHGDVGKMDRPVARQTVPLRMEGCMACHRREKITTDCMACHR